MEDGRTLAAWLWAGRGVPLVLLHACSTAAAGGTRSPAPPTVPVWPSICRASVSPICRRGRASPPTRIDVIAGLRKLGVDRCSVVGHSLGGAVATALCEQAAVEATALMLRAPAGFGPIRLAELVSVPGIRDVTGKLLPFALSSSLALNIAYSTMVTNGCRIDGATLGRVKARAARALPGARMATMAVVAAGRSSRDTFHQRRVAFHGPVTAVWGGHDRIVPRGHADGIRRAFPQASVELWPGIGHHPQRECPERLHQLVDSACGGGRSARCRGARAMAGAA